MTVGERIKQRRIELGLTQNVLDIMVGLAYVPPKLKVIISLLLK